MQVIERIQELMDMRGWSQYRLRQETQLPQSTISNIFKRVSAPNLSTLEIICKAFGISLSQFFAEGELISVSREQRELLDRWATLTERQKEAFLVLMTPEE